MLPCGKEGFFGWLPPIATEAPTSIPTNCMLTSSTRVRPGRAPLTRTRRPARMAWTECCWRYSTRLSSEPTESRTMCGKPPSASESASSALVRLTVTRIVVGADSSSRASRANRGTAAADSLIWWPKGALRPQSISMRWGSVRSSCSNERMLAAARLSTFATPSLDSWMSTRASFSQSLARKHLHMVAALSCAVKLSLWHSIRQRDTRTPICRACCASVCSGNESILHCPRRAWTRMLILSAIVLTRPLMGKRIGLVLSLLSALRISARRQQLVFF